jgi:cytochrome c oxidase subunit 2
MRSEDVIHSLYVPAFRLKMDVVPGRYNRAWFTATKVGEFPLFCAEYCGTSHSDMISSVVVHPVGGYEEWLKRAADIFSPYLRPSSYLDAKAFLTVVRDGKRPVDEFFRGRLTEETQAALAAWDGGDKSMEELLPRVTDEVNDVIDGPSIYDEARFSGVTLHPETGEYMKLEEPKPEELAQLNRFLLVDAFPESVRRGPDPIDAGQKVYQANGCAACHAVTSQGGIGPGLGGIWGKQEKYTVGTGGAVQTVVVDENYIRESIIDPKAKIVSGYENRMPTYKGQLSDRQIDALISYIKALDSEGNIKAEK